MITKNGNGEVAEFMGSRLPEVIKYDYEFSVFENLTEAKDSEDWPSDAQILKLVNQSAERKAKASAYQAAIKDVRAEYEKSPAFQRKQFIDAALAGGMALEQAEAIAASLPNLQDK